MGFLDEFRRATERALFGDAEQSDRAAEGEIYSHPDERQYFGVTRYDVEDDAVAHGNGVWDYECSCGYQFDSDDSKNGVCPLCGDHAEQVGYRRR